MALPPSRIGRYRVLGRLGQGAMGTVYRGRDEALERDVALKVMSTEHADADGLARFQREARAAARLQHPNIVTIYELGQHETGPFMALELLEGLDLQRAIETGIRPDPRLTVPVVLQVLEGLAHAHEAGIVHRDMKPSNVFLPRDRPAKVLDFGVARLAGGTTTGGLLVGTANYMSPEQVRTAPDLDGRSDLFSVGLILYELVTGEKAYRAESLIAVLYKIANEEPDLGLLPSGPAWSRLRAALVRALAKDPRARYPDARAMADDLLAALRDLGGRYDPHGPADAILRFAKGTEVPKRSPVEVPTTSATANRPASPRLEESVAFEAARPAEAPAGVIVPEAPAASRKGLALGLGAVALATGVAAVAALFRTDGATPSPPAAASARTPPPSSVAAPAPAPDGTESAGAARPSPLAATPPTLSTPPASNPSPTAPSPSAPSPSPPLASATPTPEATPPPATPPRVAPTGPAPQPPAPGDSGAPLSSLADEARLDRADVLFERGQFATAAAEARAVLARDPGNARAREVLEDAEVELAALGALKAAKAALARGDRAEALREVQRGLSRKPTDGRLTALLRELQP